MKRILLGLAIGVFANVLVTGLVRAETVTAQKSEAIGSIGERLNTAGRVRLQAQRIAKLYLQIRKGLNSDAARSQLGSAIAQMDSDLGRLSRYPGNDRTRSTLLRIQGVWGDLKATLAKTPYTLERINLVNLLAEDLSIASGKLAMQIEGEGNTATGRLLDLSLRQNMLVQRLDRLYMMAYFGDQSQGLQVDMEQTQKEFSMALSELQTAPSNSQAIRNALETVKSQWFFFGRAIEGLKSGEGSNPDHVAITAEVILEALDTVSAQYAQDDELNPGKKDFQLIRTSTRPRNNEKPL